MAIIVNGKKVAGLGKPGKSAYQSAVDGGYQGTESEFNDSLSKLNDLFTSVSDGKSAVAAAITDKGVETAADATFQTMADNIGAIETGTDTSDATATAGDILSGKTAYGASGKITGAIESEDSKTITPGKYMDIAVQGPKYVPGVILVSGDANLIPANIKSGVSIFGVQGSLKARTTASVQVSISGYGTVYMAYQGGSFEELTGNSTISIVTPGIIVATHNIYGSFEISGDISEEAKFSASSNQTCSILYVTGSGKVTIG